MQTRLASLLLLSLAGCHFSLDHITVDGVRLPVHHEESMTLEAWPENGLELAAHQGDVRVEAGAGATLLTVQLHEREAGDAHLHLENGKLLARTQSGQPCAIGRILLRTSGPVRGLKLSTGMGDVVLEGVSVEGDLTLHTGMGDVSLRAKGQAATVTLSSGMGDLDARGVHCARFEADTGMGDVRVSELEATHAELNSGMGDVELELSKGEHVKANTGMGDVELKESSFQKRELDSGLGRVREH